MLLSCKSCGKWGRCRGTCFSTQLLRNNHLPPQKSKNYPASQIKDVRPRGQSWSSNLRALPFLSLSYFWTNDFLLYLFHQIVWLGATHFPLVAVGCPRLWAWSVLSVESFGLANSVLWEWTVYVMSIVCPGKHQMGWHHRFHRVWGIQFSTITFCDQDSISSDPWASSKNQAFFFGVS